MLLTRAVAQVIACKLGGRAFTFIAPIGFQHPVARTYAKLLGPCFKTGRIDGQLLHREPVRELHHQSIAQTRQSVLLPPPEFTNDSFARCPNHQYERSKQSCTSPGSNPEGSLMDRGPTAAPQVSAQSSANAPRQPRTRHCVHSG
jgi:hypothetical protein